MDTFHQTDLGETLRSQRFSGFGKHKLRTSDLGSWAAMRQMPQQSSEEVSLQHA
jgi:hypothetical protein